MLKLTKYELYGRYKYIIGIIIGILFANCLILYKIRPSSALFKQGGAWGLSFMVVFAAVVISIISGIIIFRRDLFGETGYLVFTVPKSSSQIIGSKLLSFILELAVLSLVGGVFVIKNIYALDRELITKVFTSYKYAAFLTTLVGIMSILLVMLLSYLSLSISKVAFGNRKYGRVASFVIFIFLSWGLGKISYELVLHLMRYLWDGMNQSIGVWSLIIVFAIYNVILFCTTSFLITKKVDL